MIALGIVLLYLVPLVLLGEILRCFYLENRRDRISILLYHRLISRAEVDAARIRDEEPIYACYDDRFASQMEHLARYGYTTLHLDELLSIRQGAIPCPVRPVVITFDDGYESNYTLAWPVLRRLRLKATVFVAPHPDEYTRRQIEGIDRFLSEDQMREMDRGGFRVESHTLTHCILSELNDREARYELMESQRVLGRILSRPVRHLAIPRSGSSPRIRRLAIEAGYMTICGNHKGSANGLSDLHTLPRLVIERDMTVEDFARALEPRTALILRLIGNLKRVPTLLLGPSRAQRVRRFLYAGPFGRLFETQVLKRALGLVLILYIVAALAFTWFLMPR